MPYFDAHNVGATDIGARGVCTYDIGACNVGAPVISTYDVGTCDASAHGFGTHGVGAYDVGIHDHKSSCAPYQCIIILKTLVVIQL